MSDSGKLSLYINKLCFVESLKIFSNHEDGLRFGNEPVLKLPGPKGSYIQAYHFIMETSTCHSLTR